MGDKSSLPVGPKNEQSLSRRGNDPPLKDPARLEPYRNELEASGLLEAIEGAKRRFEESVAGATCRDNPYGFGGMKPEVSAWLCRLIRWLDPDVLVETGVCTGVSTAVMLAAMDRNSKGKLYSIDLPEFTDTPYAAGAFWEGKKGAVVPRDRGPGWELTLGDSREKLPPLLERLGSIDFFLHDSGHSAECMAFEYRTAWSHLRSGGVLASDDITWNDAFQDFARRQARPIHPLDRNLAYLIK